MGLAGSVGPGPPCPCSGCCPSGLLLPPPAAGDRKCTRVGAAGASAFSPRVRTPLAEPWDRDPPPPRASGPPCRAPPLPLFTPPPTPGNFARARSNFIWESRSVAVATTLTSEGLGPEIPRKGGGVEEGRPREGLPLTLHAPAPMAAGNQIKHLSPPLPYPGQGSKLVTGAGLGLGPLLCHPPQHRPGNCPSRGPLLTPTPASSW